MRQILALMPEATAPSAPMRDQPGNGSTNSGTPLPSSPPRRRYRNRQMRERRTAQLLVGFGIVLACVELYVILHVL